MNRRVTPGVCTSWLACLTLSLLALLAIPTIAAAQLPWGWASRDIGSVANAGNAAGGDGGFYILGDGADIWGTADGFHFAYRSLTGDGEIVARVNTVDYLDAWSKAGVMMRESLAPGSKHAFALVSAGKGTGFQRRPSTGGATLHSGAGGGPGSYVRLTRSGNNFDGYVSGDGYNWSWVGGEYIAMPATIYVGVAVTSHRYGGLSGALFGGTDVREWGGVTEAAPPPAPAPEPAPAPSGSFLRVLHWNTQHLRGADGLYNPGRTAYWIAAAYPDIVSLNEIDDEWMAEEIRSALTAWTGVYWNASFSGWGNLILTKLPMYGSSVCSFNPGARRVAAHMRTVFNGREINLYSAHLATDSTSTRIYEVSNVQSCAYNSNEARLMAGDFNMQPFSAEYNVAAASYSDAWLAAQAIGMGQNYSGNCDGCTRNSRIDYVWASYSAWFMSVAYAQIFDTRDAWGTMASDHKPMLVVYSVR